MMYVLDRLWRGVKRMKDVWLVLAYTSAIASVIMYNAVVGVAVGILSASIVFIWFEGGRDDG